MAKKKNTSWQDRLAAYNERYGFDGVSSEVDSTEDIVLPSSIPVVEEEPSIATTEAPEEKTSWLDNATAIIPGLSSTLRDIGTFYEGSVEMAGASKEQADAYKAIDYRQTAEGINKLKEELGLQLQTQYTSKAPNTALIEKLKQDIVDLDNQSIVAQQIAEQRETMNRAAGVLKQYNDQTRSAEEDLGTVLSSVVGAVAGVRSDPAANILPTAAAVLTGPLAPLSASVTSFLTTDQEPYYMEAREAGLSQEGADTYAKSQALIQSAVAGVGGKYMDKVLKLFPGEEKVIKELLARKIKGTAGRAAPAAVVEGLEEGVQTLAEQGVREAGAVVDEDLEAVAEKGREGLGKRVATSVIGGTFVGGLLSTPIAKLQTEGEIAQYENDLYRAYQQGMINEKELNSRVSQLDNKKRAIENNAPGIQGELFDSRPEGPVLPESVAAEPSAKERIESQRRTAAMAPEPAAQQVRDVRNADKLVELTRDNWLASGEGYEGPKYKAYTDAIAALQ